LEFIGLEVITSCNNGLDSWTWIDFGMAFSLLEYTRFFPNFPPSLGAGSAVGLGTCSVPAIG